MFIRGAVDAIFLYSWYWIFVTFGWPELAIVVVVSSGIYYKTLMWWRARGQTAWDVVKETSDMSVAEREELLEAIEIRNKVWEEHELLRKEQIEAARIEQLRQDFLARGTIMHKEKVDLTVKVV